MKDTVVYEEWRDKGGETDEFDSSPESSEEEVEEEEEEDNEEFDDEEQYEEEMQGNAEEKDERVAAAEEEQFQEDDDEIGEEVPSVDPIHPMNYFWVTCKQTEENAKKASPQKKRK